jgi:hypothetical protein
MGHPPAVILAQSGFTWPIHKNAGFLSKTRRPQDRRLYPSGKPIRPHLLSLEPRWLTPSHLQPPRLVNNPGLLTLVLSLC